MLKNELRPGKTITQWADHRGIEIVCIYPPYNGMTVSAFLTISEKMFDKILTCCSFRMKDSTPFSR